MAASHEPTTAPGPLRHDIGPRGTVVVTVEADDVRIRGIDGTEARVVTPFDGAGLETAAEPGRFVVRSERAARFATFGLHIGGHGIGMTIAGAIEVEVPRDARIEVRTAAGDVSVRDVQGGSSVKTASGDASLKRVAGPIAVSVASGDVLVEAIVPIALELHSVSGDGRVRAPRIDRLMAETISGDVHVTSTLAPGVEHVISTVSGDTDLAVGGGLALLLKTVSGAVDCHHPDRRSGDGRRQPLVIGDGSARLAIRSMSGDVEVRAIPPGGVLGGPPAAPPRAPRPPHPPAAPPPPNAPAVSPPHPSPAAQSETRIAEAPPADDPTLAILEALARGEIDVAEAERRLGAAAGADELSPSGPSTEETVVMPGTAADA